jgi:hypothetical protein
MSAELDDTTYTDTDFESAFGDAMLPEAAAAHDDSGDLDIPAVEPEAAAAVEPEAAAAVEPEAAAAVEPEAAAAVEPEAAAAVEPEAAAELPAGLDPKFLEQAQREEAAAAAAAAPAEVPVVPYIADDFLSAEAKASVEKFKADWPDDWRAVQSMYQSEVQAQVANAQNVLIKQLNSVLAPLFQSAEKAEVNTHMNTIRSAHSDFDAVLPEVRTWVAGQPAFLQSAYDAVLKTGSAKDVVDLVSLYKGASGTSSAAPTPASTTAPTLRVVTTPKPGVDPAAVAATAAVPAALRAKPTAAADPNDFASAFDEAQATLVR